MEKKPVWLGAALVWAGAVIVWLGMFLPWETFTGAFGTLTASGFAVAGLVLQRRLCKTAVFSGKSRPMSRLCWPSAPVIAAIRVSRSSTKAALRSYWKNPSL